MNIDLLIHGPEVQSKSPVPQLTTSTVHDHKRIISIMKPFMENTHMSEYGIWEHVARAIAKEIDIGKSSTYVARYSTK